MHRKRSHAREVALMLLFQHDLNPTVSREDVLRLAREQIDDDETRKFALALYDGTRGKIAEIDDRLGKAAENWRIVRMAVVDRNVLRLGAFELDDPETPQNVTFDEAIELARKYGSADSPAFVNGVLDRMFKDRPAPPPPAEAEPT